MPDPHRRLTPFHIAVQVRDIAEARNFYGDILGCAQGRSDPHWVDFDLYGHQFVCHLNPSLGRDGQLQSHFNPVDGHGVPVPHFGVVLQPPQWEALAERVRRAGVRFLIEPGTRFAGQLGEQSTMFFLDPTGNALEFKAFRDIDTQLFATAPPSMQLYSWNVNGIRAALKKGLFQTFLKTHEPDVLCLQETKAERGQIEIEVPGYHEFWNSATKKGYSGTALFSRVEPLRVVNGFPHEFARHYSFADELERDSAQEGRVITAEFEHLYVVTVYTPNAKDDLSRLNLRYKHWDPAFLAWCRQLEKSKPVVLCGDLNVAHTELDLANPRPNRGKKGFTDEERKGFQNFIDAGYIDTFRLFTQGNGHYSWWSHFANSRARNVGWRIDYFLVSAALRGRVRAAAIHADVMGSDHCPVSVTLG